MTSPRLSICACARATDCREADALAVVTAIRNGKWRGQVDSIRAEYARAVAEGRDPKEAVAPLKQSLPGILVSGTFATRRADALIQHSGLLCADLDNLGDRLAAVWASVVADPHVYAAFASPTGTGLKVWFRVPADAAQHAASYRSVAAHIRDLCGVEADPVCRDVARLCFVSFDPEVFINVNAIELAPMVEQRRPALPVPAPAVPAAAPMNGNGDLPPSVSALLANGAPDGQRNAQALWLACQLRDCGKSQAEVETLMAGYAARCLPPLASAKELGELAATIRSASSRAPREPARNLNSPRARLGSLAGEYLPQPGDAAPARDFDLPPAPQWPAPLGAAAYHGLAGEVVRALEPHTEADPAALLVLLISAFGNAAGPAAHFSAEGSRHPLRIWPVLVGETAKGRKGSAWSSLRYLLNLADPTWASGCIASGLSSGEGLIWRVRDPITRTKKSKDGTVESQVEDDGVSDKRLLCIEEEFSAVLKVSAREGNTVSDLLRRAWDHGDLATLTKKSPAKATGAHVTVIGHITRPELTRLLSETDSLNGFGNRFLWLAVRRSKLLPEGGRLASADLGDLILDLRHALDHARTATLFERIRVANPTFATHPDF